MYIDFDLSSSLDWNEICSQYRAMSEWLQENVELGKWQYHGYSSRTNSFTFEVADDEYLKAMLFKMSF